MVSDATSTLTFYLHSSDKNRSLGTALGPQVLGAPSMRQYTPVAIARK